MSDDWNDRGQAHLQLEAHHLRQSQIIHPNMAGSTVIIAGLGMIGGWTAIGLARAVGRLHIIDPDVVEGHNAGCQPYTERNIGEPKAEALASMLHGFDVCPHVGGFPDDNVLIPLRTREPRPSIVVSAVDSMSGRRANAEWSRDHGVPLYLDGRILGELAVLAVVDSAPGYAAYLSALLSDDDVPDVPCGSRGTAYTGMSVASQIAATINQWSKGGVVKAMRVWHVGVGVEMPQEDGE